MKVCLQMPNVHLDGVLHFKFIFLSLRNLVMLPLAATMLYIEERIRNKQGGLKDMILGYRLRS